MPWWFHEYLKSLSRGKAEALREWLAGTLPNTVVLEMCEATDQQSTEEQIR